MSKYYQCSNCKKLVTLDSEKLESTNVVQDNGGNIDVIKVKPENLPEIVCHDRRMREFKTRGATTAQAQYDHEVLQRAWVDGGKTKGSEPSGTDLMTAMKI